VSLVSLEHEWLETDGLGGYSSGTTELVPTRRYHALLLSALSPPSSRHVFVHDAVIWLETPQGSIPLSRHPYAPGGIVPEAPLVRQARITPWPEFHCQAGGIAFSREIVLLHGLPLALVRLQFESAIEGATLCLRPLLSGRDPHWLHRENPNFLFGYEGNGEHASFELYAGLPRVLSVANGVYQHEPDWYRNFFYQEELARGFDATEDLASPGVLRFDLRDKVVDWIVAVDCEATRDFLGQASAHELSQQIRAREIGRRGRFPTKLERAADQYLARRADGKTLMAGYPWFGDWGRDTFIALRGLCLATGRVDEATLILCEWAKCISLGMLPNRFSDRADEPAEYNSVDASLWYVIAIGEVLERHSPELAPDRVEVLKRAMFDIISGYAAGTRHNIRLDDDGLLAAGEAGFQLTWMDAKIGDFVVTPRIGKPVEVQALWLNALHFAQEYFPEFRPWLDQGLAGFADRFDLGRGSLPDVVDVDHVPGLVDMSLRPNQVLAVGGLPLALLPLARCREVLELVESSLVTPLGLRSLAPGHPDYRPHYRGGPWQRDTSYHQGTVWPWLLGPFVQAWVKSRGGTHKVKDEARSRFVAPFYEHLDHAAGLGHISEIADAEPPHIPRGCPFQAWSLGELLRIEKFVLNAS
jgi:predicted glycogen debranching enzyme